MHVEGPSYSPLILLSTSMPFPFCLGGLTRVEASVDSNIIYLYFVVLLFLNVVSFTGTTNSNLQTQFRRHYVTSSLMVVSYCLHHHWCRQYSRLHSPKVVVVVVAIRYANDRSLPRHSLCMWLRCSAQRPLFLHCSLSCSHLNSKGCVELEVSR